MVAAPYLEPLSRSARLARRCVEKLRLTLPIDVVRLAEECQVPVLEQPPGGPEEDAFLAYHPGTDRWAIFLNPSFRDPFRRRFTLAHELGHYLLHRQHIQATGQTANDSFWMEAEANEFARELLMPMESVLVHSRMGLADWQVRRIYGVSMAAWQHRLTDIGILSRYR